MTKTISVSEAKNKLSAMLDWTVENREEIIVESRGQPKAVILAYEEYEAVAELREKLRRQAVWERMQELAAAVQARNQDLSPEEADQVADAITRETINRMVNEGKVSFKNT